MSYHRGGHPGAVAVSFSTSTMAPLSPTRRYPGSTGTSVTSGTNGSAPSKYASYRSSSSSTSASLAYERNGSYYSSSSNAGFRSGSFTSSGSSDIFKRNYYSPARSVASFNETNSSVVGSSLNGSGLGRYGSASSSSASSTTSSNSSSSRDRTTYQNQPTAGSIATTVADLYAIYSPTRFVPNISSATAKGNNKNWRQTSATSNNSEDCENSRDRRSYSVESNATGSTDRWSTRRDGKRRVPTPVNGRTGIAHQPIGNGLKRDSSASPIEDESSSSRPPRSRIQWRRDERYGLNGLRNIGNTCFMNSVIQCLSNTRPLLEYLLNEQHLHDINTTTSSMKGALIKAFGQVIHELWEVSGDHVVNTTAFKTQIQRFAPRFIGYSQQDAQEFLRYLLEGLHEDVNRVTVKPQPILTDIPDHYSDGHKASESWKRYLRSEDSTIVDVFVGQLRSSLHCTSCDHVSVTLDPFWDLSLPIPSRSGTVKLNQCLEHFTKVETLDGDEKPTCSKCQMRRKCTKSFSIQKFPKILVIHLKRFSPTERFRGKLSVLVDFPLNSLDLSAFAAPGVQGPTYNLYGVANHSGTTYSGHYTAYCKHPYSSDWHEYNDNRVSTVPARSVASSEAYVLFYEQQTPNPHL